MDFDVLKKQWDRAAAIVLTVLGVVLIINGWIGVSGTALQYEQAPYMISGGIGGMFLLVLGAALWISADLRDEWNKLDRVEKRLDSIEHALAGAAEPAVREGTASAHAVSNSGAESAHAGGSGHHVREDRAAPALSVAGRKHA